EVEPGTTSGDYLSGFLQGTRQALWERGRQSITLTIEQLDAKSLGMLIALYERAVGFYASLVNINAYHQPGVEAGKKAAQAILDLQAQVLMTLRSARGREMSVLDIATAAGATDLVAIFSILQHLVANGRGVTRKVPEGKTVTEAVYSAT
ncbi:MAG: glucose-6-phosphate isomerase, partial [Polyangiaceae bacterium]